MFEAICLPRAWKVTGLNVGSHITNAKLELGSLHATHPVPGFEG